MKLRDYLEMKMKGEIIWPHLNLMQSVDKALVSGEEIEQSVLKKVSLRKTVEYYTHLDLEVEYDGQTYSTSFLWDDQQFLSSLYKFLKENIGHSIRDIGNLEFP